MSMMVTHSYFRLYSLYGLFGRIVETDHLTMEDKQVVFTADKDEWKEATKYFASLNAEGLLDPEGFTQDRSTLFAKGKTDPMILGASNPFLLDNVVGANKMESYVPVLLEGMNGERTIRYSEYPIQSRTHSVVHADLENPEGLMRFFDVCLDESKHYPLRTTFGLIGKQIVEADDGSDK